MQSYIFRYLGIDFKLNFKTYMLLKTCISNHLEALISENNHFKVDSVEIPVYSLKLIKWKISISTIDGNTTIVLFRDNKIFNSTTYTYDSLYSLSNTLFS